MGDKIGIMGAGALGSYVGAFLSKIGEDVTITITSVLQTSAGRMIFGRPEGVAPPDRRRRSRAVT